MLPTPFVTFGAAPDDVTCLVETATIRHGRDDPTSQPEASACTFDIWGTLPAGVDIGTPVVLTAMLESGPWPRFAGTITDLSISWAGPDQPISQVVAVGDMARMGNRIIGTSVYPKELDGARVNRAIMQAGVWTDAERTDPGTVALCPRDTNPADALSVAHEAATDGGGILWQTKDGATVYADAHHRRATAENLTLDSCAMPLDVAWRKDLEGMVNDLTLDYCDEVTPPAAALGETIGSYLPGNTAETGDHIGANGFLAQPIVVPAGQFMHPAGGYIILTDSLDLHPGEDIVIGIASAIATDQEISWLAYGSIREHPAPPDATLGPSIGVIFNTVPTLDAGTIYWLVVQGTTRPVETIGVQPYTSLTIAGFTDGISADPITGHAYGGDMGYGLVYSDHIAWTQSTSLRLLFAVKAAA